MPRPGHGTVAVGDRFTVVVELDVGDAVVVDQAAHHGAQMFQPTATALADAFGQLEPGWPDIACCIDEFVVSGGDRAAARIKQRLLGPRRAVAGQQVVDVVGQCAARSRNRLHGIASGTSHYRTPNGPAVVSVVEPGHTASGVCRDPLI